MHASPVGKKITDKLNAATIYTLISTAIFATSVIATASSMSYRWSEVILVAVMITILEISNPQNSGASITVTSAIILTSSTNFGLFSTELSLLLSLPFLLFYYRRRWKLSSVFFNTSSYGVSALFSLPAYKALGGVIGYYGHHIIGLIGYSITFAISNLVGASMFLFFTYIKTISGREAFEKVREALEYIGIKLFAVYLIEMVIGVLGGISYQLYGIPAMVVVFIVLWMILHIYRLYYHTIHQAETDDLTGLMNRKAFQQRVVRNMKKKTQLSLIMMDLDHFKRINDSLGHQSGDEVLKATAGLIKDVVGKTGVVARYGGEEFCVLFFGDEKSAYALAEQLRSMVDQHRFAVGEELHVTISIGITPVINSIGWETIFAFADKALYEAKSMRNTVKVYHAEEAIQSLLS